MHSRQWFFILHTDMNAFTLRVYKNEFHKSYKMDMYLANYYYDNPVLRILLTNES